MSDLLAPVLAEIQNESDAFWCFVGLMQKAIFVCTPTDNDMDRNLVRILYSDIFSASMYCLACEPYDEVNSATTSVQRKLVAVLTF